MTEQEILGYALKQLETERVEVEARIAEVKQRLDEYQPGSENAESEPETPKTARRSWDEYMSTVKARQARRSKR